MLRESVPEQKVPEGMREHRNVGEAAGTAVQHTRDKVVTENSEDRPRAVAPAMRRRWLGAAGGKA